MVVKYNMSLAVIFDLDGTLWDSTTCVCDIWNQVLERHDDISLRITEETLSQLMGKTMDEIGKSLFPSFDAKARKAITDELSHEEVDYLRENGAVLYAGLENTLKELRQNHKLYIVSNCQDGYIQVFLHYHKLGSYFDDFEMSGRTGLDKASNIKLLMERNDIDSAVYIGDTETDEKSARIAAIPFIYAKYGFGKAVSPDAVIENITKLPKCIKSFR